MIKLFPVELELLFEQRPNIKRKVKVKSHKNSNLKKIHKNRNNTIKAENEKAAQLLEKYLNFVPSENNVDDDDVKNISDIDITSALLRWGLIGKKLQAKYENKDVRKNAVKRARERKSVLQDYDFEKESKESNLKQLVAELEAQDELKEPAPSLKSLAAWVVLIKSFENSRKTSEIKTYYKSLQDLAEVYFQSGKIADDNFVQKINATDDLQDLYELNHYNMRFIINTVNQRNK